jgi:hypothetical protein
LSSYLCEHGFDSGWPSIFYLYGIFGAVWFILFMIFASDSPKNNKFLSEKEKYYIVESSDNNYDSKALLRAPWKAMFTSTACYACYLGNFAFCWGNYLFLTELPTYMKEVLNFDIKSVI